MARWGLFHPLLFVQANCSTWQTCLSENDLCNCQLQNMDEKQELKGVVKKES